MNQVVELKTPTVQISPMGIIPINIQGLNSNGEVVFEGKSNPKTWSIGVSIYDPQDKVFKAKGLTNRKDSMERAKKQLQFKEQYEYYQRNK